MFVQIYFLLFWIHQQLHQQHHLQQSLHICLYLAYIVKNLYNMFYWILKLNFALQRWESPSIFKWISRESRASSACKRMQYLTSKGIWVSNIQKTTYPCMSFVWEVLTIHGNELCVYGPWHSPHLTQQRHSSSRNYFWCL